MGKAEINKKRFLSLILLSTLTSCVSLNQADIINYNLSNNIESIKLSQQKGAEISFIIKSSKNTFNSKANADGYDFKKSSDIENYLVYLIKNSSTTGYPSGGDPFNDIAGGPILIPNLGASTKQIRFSNIPISDGNAYYIAVRALGASNTDIVKDNNGSLTPWTGITKKTNPRIAVSSGNGVIVDSNYHVNSTDPLIVTLNLLDQNYASLKAEFNIRNGSATPFSITTSTPTFFINNTAGTTNGFSGDSGQATASKLNRPQGITSDTSGNIYIADRDNHRIRKISTSGIITTIAGSGATGLGLGSFSGDSGQATVAKLNSPTGVSLDTSGNIYIADKSNNRIRKISTSGVITTIAGTGTASFSGDDGQATSATLNLPSGVENDIYGNLYIVDSGNHRIRKVDSSGVITTIAGTGTSGFSGDGGQATAAKLNAPLNIYASRDGFLFISDTNNQRIRKIDLSGVITTIAGSSSVASFSGDNGQATAAKLNFPNSIDFDGMGNMYIVDSGNHRVRKVDSSGIITTIAGSATSGSSGDGGQATLATLNSPSSLTFDLLGNFYISDFANDRVRKIYKD